MISAARTVKNILLTGSGGFIGKNLKNCLEREGFSIIAPRSADFDFTDLAALQKLCAQAQPDVFIHAGFYGMDNPWNTPKDTMQVNKKILDNLVTAAQGRPVFMFGSGAEYDKNRPLIKARESDAGTHIPTDNYGKAKYLLGQYAEQYPNVYNLRLFGVYGPHENPGRFISYAIAQSLKREAITIKQNVIFDYLYVEDLCEIMLCFIRHAPMANTINITPDKSIDLMAIADIINHLSDYKSEVIVKTPGLANQYTGDNSILKSEIEDLQFTPYRQGIAKLYKHLNNLISL